MASAISALNFVGGFTRLDELVRIAASKRIIGASSEKLERLPPRRQAKAMSPEQVCILEVFVADTGQSFLDRQILWIYLVMSALRARFADLRNLISHSVADRLLEVQPRKTKTSRLDKSRLPLAMVGPTELFSDADWFDVHLESRNFRGIPFGEWEFSPSNIGHEFLNTPCKTSDYSSALRQVLTRLNFVDPDSYSAHSAKATMLSFAAFSGMTPEDRGILGYHRPTGVSGSVRSYDRSKQIAQVLKLAGHLETYRGIHMPLEEPLDSGEVSCSESSSSSSDEDETDKGPTICVGLILNEARGTLHRPRLGDQTRTTCGLLMRSHYREVSDEKESTGWLRCNRGCFKLEASDCAPASDSS